LAREKNDMPINFNGLILSCACGKTMQKKSGIVRNSIKKTQNYVEQQAILYLPVLHTTGHFLTHRHIEHIVF